MTHILLRKLLRDVRVALFVIALLLFAFQLLWAEVTRRVVVEILTAFAQLGVPIGTLRSILFQQSGKVIQTLIGGETISLDRAQDMMSISYVHPLVQLILCIWAIGRAAGALAGEIDRGTMELLLAQPIRRSQVVFAHLGVDAVVIPILAAAIGLGTYVGIQMIGFDDPSRGNAYVDIRQFLPALVSIGLMVYAVSGTTMAVSAFGRNRGRTLGVAVLVILLQFLLNVIGQLWPPLEPLRPATVFFYYQPQQMILAENPFGLAETWGRLGVLLAIGATGYAIAMFQFCRRDLPAAL